LKTLTVIAAAEKHIREKEGFSDFGLRLFPWWMTRPFNY
jgi:hypothetical protein